MTLPVPLGRDTTPRTIWFALRGSTPKRTSISREASNLVVVISFTNSETSFKEYAFPASTFYQRLIFDFLSVYSFL